MPTSSIAQALEEVQQLRVRGRPLDESLQEALDTVCRTVRLGAPAQAALFLVEGGRLRMAAHHDLDVPLRHECALVPFGHCLCGRVAQTREPLFVDHVDHRHDIGYPGMPDHGHYVLPLTLEGENLGVLNLYLRPGHEHDRLEQSLLQTIATELSLIVKRHRLAAASDDADHHRRALFDSTLDAMLLADDEGHVVDANPAAEALLGRSRDEILTLRPWDITPASNRARGFELWQMFVRGSEQSGEYEILRKDGTTRSVSYRAVANVLPGRHLSVLRDVTDRKRAEQALTMLAEGSRILTHAKQEGELFDEVCRIAVETGGFALAWIGRAPVDPDGSIRPIARAGTATDFLDRVEVSSDEDDPFGRGPTGSAVRTGRTTVVRDITESTDHEPWREVAERMGFRSLCALPLWLDGTVFGTLTLYHAAPGYFCDDVVVPLRRLAQTLQHGIASLRLKADRDLLTTAVEQTPESIFITDRSGVIVYANPALERQTGFARSEILGNRPTVLKSGHHPPRFYQKLWSTLLAGEPFHAVFCNRRKNGELIYEEKFLTPIEDDDGEITHFVSTGRDVTERKRLERELSHLAHHDPLTGLGNRRLFTEQSRQILAMTSRHEQSACLLLMDLNDFKKVNDTLGHAAGDELLVTVTERFRTALRDSDLLVRLGGDEFAILLPECGPDQVSRVANRILTSLAEPIELSNGHAASGPLFMHASIGIAHYPHDGTHLDELMRKADIAMYRVKAAGGGFACYDAGEDHYTHDRLRLEADLRHALDAQDAEGESSQGLTLHYQPGVEISSGRVMGVEALMRWQHPTHGNVAPGSFLGLAEDTGLIVPLDRFVLREAVHQLGAWRHQAWRVAVNLSPTSLRDPSLVTYVGELLRQHGADPSRLCIEITERMLAESRTIPSVLNAFKNLGASLALDDFGTGYASLNYLGRYDLDYLKIDKSFVGGIGGNRSDETIVRTIIGMAHNLGMEVIAEGVETMEQFRWLEAHGCDFAQGFLFTPALPPDSLRAWIATYGNHAPGE